MDSVKGAIELKARLDRLAPDREREASAHPQPDAAALPLFRWTGVQPPAPENDPGPQAA